jgi:hypothetical protein
VLRKEVGQLPNETARILDAGTGSRRWLDVTPALLPKAKGPILYVEGNLPRAQRAKLEHRAGIEVIDSLGDIEPGQKFDLIYLDTRRFTRQTAQTIAPLLAPGGRCIVTMRRSDVAFECLAFQLRRRLGPAHRPFDGRLMTCVIEPASEPKAKQHSRTGKQTFLARLTGRVWRLVRGAAARVRMPRSRRLLNSYFRKADTCLMLDEEVGDGGK